MGNIWPVYRKALMFLPKHGRMHEAQLEKAKEAEKILRKHRCLGASLCIFDSEKVLGTAAFGEARKGVPAAVDTVYRIASVSKLVTAMGAMKLQEKGVLSIDRDVADYFPFSLRHPKAPDTPITLRMLMSHTAGIHDGVDYNSGIAKNVPLSSLLKGDSFCAHLPGETWEYSNFGAGIAGAVMEAAAGMDFEALMQKEVFSPLGVQATFYPQKVQGELADATRILPPQKSPNFNAGERMARSLPEETCDAEHHYNLAHGNLCISAKELAKLSMALMQPGFLTEESLQDMRKVILPFGQRAHNLSQGVGTFILQDESICSRPLYGHQGMAYGACHGLFFDVETKKGMVLLTSGVSEARDGVLSDVNKDMLRLYLAEE